MSWAPEVWQLAGVDRRDPMQPGIDAYSIRMRWRTLEPTPGNYRWGFIDQELARCQAAGVQLVFRLMAGTSSPAWAVDDQINDPRGKLPDPRTPHHRAAIRLILGAIASRYGRHLRAVHVPGFGNSAESNRPKGWDDLQAHGATLSQAYTERAAHLASLVGPARTICNWGNVTAGWVRAAAGKCADLEVGAQHNSLKASTKPNADHHQLVWTWPHLRGFQAVSPSGNVEKFGGTVRAAVELALRARPAWLEMYQADIARALTWRGDPGPSTDLVDRIAAELAGHPDLVHLIAAQRCQVLAGVREVWQC